MSMVMPHLSPWNNTHARTQAMDQYVDQRSPALQPLHSFSALYANMRAGVRDRHMIVAVDYHRFTNSSSSTEKVFPAVYFISFYFMHQYDTLRLNVREVTHK